MPTSRGNWEGQGNWHRAQAQLKGKSFQGVMRGAVKQPAPCPRTCAASFQIIATMQAGSYSRIDSAYVLTAASYTHHSHVPFKNAAGAWTHSVHNRDMYAHMQAEMLASTLKHRLTLRCPQGPWKGSWRAQIHRAVEQMKQVQHADPHGRRCRVV